MDIRALTSEYAVSPQITPDDVRAIAAAGYRTIICNRPDYEVVAEVRADAVRSAAEAEGLHFVVNPLPQGDVNSEAVEMQRSAIETSDGPTLAYCASGTRSTIVWMFGAAANVPAGDLVEAAHRAGYPLASLRPLLEPLSKV
ncbi:uncharacterized protein (TIGR01244 family) [Aliiruegeria haliotis]|uniref:Uncharacterized protein (TIGR01244 family) n=1 Tax=Aliiruegeria haliotis TaxID=1280846 RepID=A0A2T0RK41_9RHOB|nr:TIGR01244 family sulfur transferase [Aliiruegeria haliotis]PRY21556.1 uncharacterized protein (TIGR01244 family) [Aliiruegeria haliotis]